eukprot:scaffold605164_cov18-Prasinocladus_malaysianus.AAC.1
MIVRRLTTSTINHDVQRSALGNGSDYGTRNRKSKLMYSYGGFVRAEFIPVPLRMLIPFPPTRDS